MAEVRKVALLGGALVSDRTRSSSSRREDWTDAARADLAEGARSVLSRRGFAMDDLSSTLDSELRPLFEQSWQVLEPLGQRAYGFSRTRVLDDGDYVVPGVAPVLDRVGADLLLFALVLSERWFAERPWSFSSGTVIWLALIDHTGRVVWMNTSSPDRVNVDITKPRVLRRWVADMLDELPAAGPTPASIGAAPIPATGS
jgi:hypothetical protein